MWRLCEISGCLFDFKGYNDYYITCINLGIFKINWKQNFKDFLALLKSCFYDFGK